MAIHLIFLRGWFTERRSDWNSKVEELSVTGSVRQIVSLIQETTSKSRIRKALCN